MPTFEIKRPKKSWRKPVELILGTVAVLFMIRTLGTHGAPVAQHVTHVNGLLLVVAWLGFVAYFLLRALAWQYLLAILGSRVSFTKAVSIWCLAEAQRYIPGNVWSLLGRTYLGQKAGLSRKPIVMSLVLEIALLVGSALVFVAGALVFWPNPEFPALRWLGLLIFPVLVLIALPRWLVQSINSLLRRFKKEPLAITVSPQQMIVVLVLFCLAWLAYGSASYIVMRAFLVPQEISTVWLICIFVAAWLVGYLSFLPPMGLGVREGVVVFALAPVISTGLASFVAIVTRVWLIITELTVLSGLGLVMVIKNWHAHRAPLRKWCLHHGPEILLGLGLLAFIGYFGTYSFLRHYHFISSRFDLGIMDQTVWNTTHGRFFQLTQPDGTVTISRFAIHADIFLVLLAPFYWVIPSPYTLLAIQVIVVAFGALPLYWLGKEMLKSRWLALIIALSYLLFPPLQRAITFDFHAVMLVNALLIFAFYCLYKRRYGWFLVFALLTLMTKETMAFIIILFGFYAIVAQKQWRLGLGTMALAAAWFYLLLWHLMPSSRSDGTAHFALNYYNHLGNSPGAILRTLFLKPQVWFPTFFTRDHLHYLLFFLVPTGFLALFSPLVLFALPELFVNLLSNNPLMATYYFQYISGITPCVFIALVFGAKRLKDFLGQRGWSKHAVPILGSYIIATSLLGLWLWSPLPGMRWPDSQVWSTYLPGEDYLRILEKTIPATAIVSATNNLAAHFSEREKIYLFPLGVGEADYIFIQEGQNFELQPIAQMSQAIRELERDTRYKQVYKNGAVEVFEKVKN